MSEEYFEFKQQLYNYIYELDCDVKQLTSLEYDNSNKFPLFFKNIDGVYNYLGLEYRHFPMERKIYLKKDVDEFFEYNYYMIINTIKTYYHIDRFISNKLSNYNYNNTNSFIRANYIFNNVYDYLKIEIVEIYKDDDDISVEEYLDNLLDYNNEDCRFSEILCLYPIKYRFYDDVLIKSSTKI